MLTIVLSGPGGFRGQALAALNAAGLVEVGGDPSHGLPDCTDGSTDASVTFITVHGTDVNEAASVISGLGWELRSYWPNTDLMGV